MDFSENETKDKLLEGGIQKIIVVRQESKYSPNAPVLSVVDTLLSIFVVTPLVVLSWRGSWGLMDIYNEYFDIVLCFFAGMILHIILAISQHSLHALIVESDKHWSLKIVSHFLRRLYTYAFLTITVFHWRGGWGLIDYYMNIQFTKDFRVKKEESHWFLIIWGASFATLATIKGLRNATAPPFAICIDKGYYVFRFPTMFRRKSDHNIYLFILDCIFSVAVMGNLVVTFWRGLWMIIDIVLFPNDYLWSSWMSLILGLLLVGLVFRLQNCMKNLCTKYSGVPKLVIADFYIVLSCVATILYWRGAWYLYFIYILPDNVELSCIVCHLIGFMALVVIGCSNSLLVRGVYKDGKEENGECVVFPCHYLKIILEQENIDDVKELAQDISKA